eukprot:m.392991 g.392991  ORF g.392991 m.392991 type:complete len:193 (-) comp20088_c7_seq1:88-666(-)
MKRQAPASSQDDDQARPDKMAATADTEAATIATTASATTTATATTQDEFVKKFEYLDHTADIQIHAWGETLKEAYEQAVVGMFGYITELDGVDIDPQQAIEFEVEGHDHLSLLFALMDEFLFRFCAEEEVVCKRVCIQEFDTENFKIKVRGEGEKFDLKKHEQGTEIKAITYSNMQIHQDKPTHDIYVIVDI